MSQAVNPDYTVQWESSVYSQSVGEHDELGGVVEHDADALIAELVAEAVLVAVVHPLADPHQRLRRRVAQLVRQALRTTF